MCRVWRKTGKVLALLNTGNLRARKEAGNKGRPARHEGTGHRYRENVYIGRADNACYLAWTDNPLQAMIALTAIILC